MRDARISFLVQTRAGFEEKFTERLRAVERLRVAEKKQGVVIKEGQRKQVVCYELKREPLTALVLIIMVLEDALLSMQESGSEGDSNNLETL